MAAAPMCPPTFAGHDHPDSPERPGRSQQTPSWENVLGGWCGGGILDVYTVPHGTVYCCFSGRTRRVGEPTLPEDGAPPEGGVPPACRGRTLSRLRGQPPPERGGRPYTRWNRPAARLNTRRRETPRNRQHEERDEMTDTQVTWLTQESHDRLKAELDQLISNRPVIAAEINDRREEGDLRENGGYHAAREEQGQQEARIRQLQDLLNNAKVGEAPKQSGVALPGSVVKVYYNGDKSDSETFLIATRQEGVNDGKLEVYSPNSPLGGALIDAKVGETRSYTVPNGNTVKVTLVSAEPYHS